MERIDERIPGIELPLMSVSQTRGVIRRSELTDAPQRAASLDTYKVCRKNDIVFNKMSIRAGAMGIAPEDGLVTYHYEVMRPRRGTDPRFVVYLMKSSWFTQELIKRERGIGAGEQANVRTTEVPFSVLRTIDAHVPEPQVQTLIGDYLDRETAQIDTLIADQQRLMGLLGERRDAVVELAVADLDWRTPLRAITSLIQTGPFGSQLKSQEYVPGGTPVINPSHFPAGVIAPDAAVAVSDRKARDLARHALETGDLIVARRGELGRSAVVTIRDAGNICGTGSALIRPISDRVYPRFLHLVFGTQRNRDTLAMASVGSTMDNLNAAILAALRVPLPALETQRELVQQVGVRTGQIDALIAESERFIELAWERRSALITAAVTGQIDVRQAVA